MQAIQHDRVRRISIRRPSQLLSREIPRQWYGGNAFASHFLDALSSTFPFGEAFFVRSILHYRDQIEDEALLEAIRGSGDGTRSRRRSTRRWPSTSCRSWRRVTRGVCSPRP